MALAKAATQEGRSVTVTDLLAINNGVDWQELVDSGKLSLTLPHAGAVSQDPNAAKEKSAETEEAPKWAIELMANFKARFSEMESRMEKMYHGLEDRLGRAIDHFDSSVTLSHEHKIQAHVTLSHEQQIQAPVTPFRKNENPVTLASRLTKQATVTLSQEQETQAPITLSLEQENQSHVTLSTDSDTKTKSSLAPQSLNKPMSPPPGMTRLKSQPPGFNRLTPPPPGFIPKTVAQPGFIPFDQLLSNAGVQPQLSPDESVTSNRSRPLHCSTPQGLVNSDKHESHLPTHSSSLKVNSTSDSVSPPPGFSTRPVAQSQSELAMPDSSDGSHASKPTPCCTPSVLIISAETIPSSGTPHRLVKTKSTLSTANSAVTPLTVNTQACPPSSEPVSTSNISKATPSPLQPRSRHTKKAHLWSNPSPKHPHEQEPLSKSPTHVSPRPQNTRSQSTQAVAPKKKVEVESCVVDLATLVLYLLFVLWTLATPHHGMLVCVAQQGPVTLSLCSLYRHCGALLRGSGEQTPD